MKAANVKRLQKAKAKIDGLPEEGEGQAGAEGQAVSEGQAGAQGSSDRFAKALEDLTRHLEDARRENADLKAQIMVLMKQLQPPGLPHAHAQHAQGGGQGGNKEEAGEVQGRGKDGVAGLPGAAGGDTTTQPQPQTQQQTTSDHQHSKSEKQKKGRN